MSKVTKFITSPGLFWRDFFLKRNPIVFAAGDVISGPARKPEAAARSSKPAGKAKTVKKTAPRDNEKLAATMLPSPHNHQREIVQGTVQATFPIDFVITWVDGDDPDFIRERDQYLPADARAVKKEAVDHARFESRDELRYTLRSIWLYAPWVNHVFVVTNGQVPDWLDLSNPKVTLVRHDEIIPAEYLPTFNSHVIESCLHRIPGLCEHYVYFNDDVMLTRRLDPTYFFTETGLAYLFPTKSVLPNGPQCSTDTPTQWAAKNARDLIYQKYGVFLSAMYAHTFHPQVKAVAQAAEAVFSDAYQRCRANKYRDRSDLLTTSFLNHNIAYLTQRALLTTTRCFYFNIRTPQALRYYDMLLARQGTEAAPHSMCLNDHLSSVPVKFPDYADRLAKFLNAYFPFRSAFELPPPQIPASPTGSDALADDMLCDVQSIESAALQPGLEARVEAIP